jgi:molecular chaperone HtpG
MKKTNTFKTESQKLLHMMAHSIYTHHEIFLRELISNASDAIDKRDFLSLTDNKVSKVDNEIRLIPNLEARTLTISDSGIGFTEEDLIENLGTIAKSGTKAFQESSETDVELIGQFGVGFYSAFMVAKEVQVRTRSPLSDKGYLWISDGVDAYTVEEIDKDSIGTEITLVLREDEEELNFSKFLETYELKQLVKKFSDYIKYPIRMLEVKTVDKKETQEDITLNQMTPIWKKDKKEVSKESLDAFYKHQFNDYEEPLKVIHTNVEGLITYTALLFIPKKPAYNFYSETFEKGLQLYSKGVFIEDKNKELIPDYFKFVRGLVDSSDLSLNISRELLQNDRQLKKIASHIEKKIKSELEAMLKDDRSLYNELYDAYKLSFKYGIYELYGMNKEKLQDLIMFKTSKSDEYITLKEYLDRKPEDQKVIYYVTGKTKNRMLQVPQMDALKAQDLEVLLCFDDVDEFMFQAMQNYQDVSFKSILQGDLETTSKSTKDEVKKLEKTFKEFLTAIKKSLDSELKEVKISSRLTESPVCVVSGEGLSLEMEKVLNQMPQGEKVKADRILELNGTHPLIIKLNDVFTANPDKIGSISKVLYHQALVAEGLSIEDPKQFMDAMTDLLV